MERVKKLLFVVASSLLFFCFPAFADEVEAADLPIEEVNHDIELVNDSTKEASNVSIDNLAEIQGGALRAPSINPDSDFSFLGFDITGSPGNYVISSNYVGTMPAEQINYVINDGTQNTWWPARSPNYNTGVISMQSGNILTVFYDEGSTRIYLWYGNVPLSSGGNVSTDTANITLYLSDVGSIFTWLLATIGTLITFILGNPFLAVSLLLFMAGTVISFYVRIKNS